MIKPKTYMAFNEHKIFVTIEDDKILTHAMDQNLDFDESKDDEEMTNPPDQAFLDRINTYFKTNFKIEHFKIQ